MPNPHPSQTRRPRMLSEVMLWANELGHADEYLREFLDEFYVERNSAARINMLQDEPPLAVDAHANAYMGAVAEHLAKQESAPAPAWADGASRFLKRPYFPCGLESLKAILLVESPVAFRRRMIFVGAEPLYRPRKDAIGIGHLAQVRP
jgi:hypothetical protein